MKKLIAFLLTIHFSLLTFNAFSQKQGQALLDSLLTQLPNAKEDTSKVNLLVEICFAYSSINLDESINYGNQALTLAEKLNLPDGQTGWKKGIAYAKLRMAFTYYRKGEFEKLSEYSLKSLAIYEDINDKLGIARSLNVVGIASFSQSDFPKALSYWLRSLKLMEVHGTKKEIASSLTNIGNVYASTRESAKGLEYYGRALKINEELGYQSGIALTLTNMARIYSSQSDYPKALEYYFKALKINEELGNKLGIAENLDNIGTIYSFQPDYPKALEYILKALRINEEMGAKSRIAENLYNIARMHFSQSDYPKALEYHFKLLKLNEELGNKLEIADVLNSIGKVYKIQSDYPKALEYQLKSLKINEELGAKSGIALNLGDIGSIYFDQSDYPKALEYYLKALEINEEWGNKEELAFNLGTIGNVYAVQSDYPKALEYDLKSLKINEELGNKPGITMNLNNIGIIYTFQSDYPKAMEYSLKALKINEEIGNKSGVAINLGAIGSAYLDIANDSNKANLNKIFAGNNSNDARERALQEAKNYSNRANVLFKEIGDLQGLFTSYKTLSEIDALLGDQQGALAYFKNYTLFKDSVFNLEKDKKLTQSALRYEFDKQQDSIKLENDKRELKLQKEIELKALKYEYDKKQALAKTEKEKQQLKFEQELKEKEIENDYNKKMAQLTLAQQQKEEEQRRKEAERKQREALAKVEQDKKELTQKNIRNSILLGLGISLAFLSLVFRQRNKIAKGKKQSDALLLNILPEEVAEELKHTGGSMAKQYNHVSVLFTDFVNFTGIGEQLSPTELVAEIHKNFTAFDAIIEKHGLEKIKTIGDAYLAVCGLPNETANHAQRVVKAALEIRNYIATSQGKFQIRIGINSGSVVAGIVGVKKYAYDIWGDTVNTANRMEANSEAGKINISGSTYELVKDDFKCEHRGKISVKGKGEVDMYFVEN